VLAATYREDTMRIDTNYWRRVFELRRHGETRYGTLEKLVCALLSIFTGPLMEATVNIMDDIVEKDCASMTVENYEGVAIVKTALKKRVKAVTMKVDTQMKRLCINAFQTYNDHQIKNWK
jgi:hypothetical protein